MKLYLSFLWLAAGAASANIQPIEPVTTPIVNEQTGLNIQMNKYEVNIGEHRRFVAATGYQVPQKCMLFSPSSWPSPEKPENWDHPELVDNAFKPVSCIGMKGAIAYAEWLSETTNKPYRLPILNE